MLNEKEKTLLERAYKILKENESYFNGRRLILPSKTFQNYKGVWNWDSAFIALAVAEWDVGLALEQCDMFFDNMKENGMIVDAFIADGRVYDSTSKPPVFAWVLKEIVTRYDRYEIIDKYYDKLVKNESFWTNYRCRDGLFHYDAFSHGKNYERDARNESGWDTSVRWDNGAHNVYAVDLNCYMVLFYRTLAFFAEKKGLKENRWKDKERDLSKRINDKLWNSDLNTYMDYDYENSCFTNVLSPASFMPLFIEIAPKDKAQQMEILAESDNFYPLMPCVSYKDTKYNARDYWRGPTWINIAYFAIKGIKNYGYLKIAEEYKNNILNMCSNEKRSIYEYYDSKTGEGLNAEKFSWSCVFIIEFIKHF